MASTMPDFSGFLPTILFLIAIIVSVTLFLVHEFWLLPAISRAFRKSKWSKGITAFIQDLSGNVLLIISKKDLPEGVTKTSRGWFLLPMAGTPLSKIPGTKAYRPESNSIKLSTPCPECGATNKHFKNCSKPPRPKQTEEANSVVPNRPDVKSKNYDKEMEEYVELYGKMVHVPILRGLGKQVFFGCMESPMLSSIWTIAHCDLLMAKGLVPMNMQKTQLDALATGSRIEGMKMMGGDVMKWIVYVIIACIPIAIVGLVFWFLTQGKATA